jgi:hypothetical protein
VRFAPCIAAVVVLALPAPTRAAVECGVESRGPEGPAGDSVAITTTEPDDGVALFREGDRIAVSDDRRMLPVDCAGGPAMVQSVDSIELVTTQPEPFLYVDISRGGLVPGVEGESDGEPEIELSVEWPNGFLGMGGTRGPDLFSFGNRDGALVGALNADDDVDVSANTAGTLLIRGQGGDDAITGRGLTEANPRQAEPPPGPLRTYASFEGGPGNDTLVGGVKQDILYGGRGGDLILADGGGRDEIDCGAGRDEVFVGSRDRVRRCERVVR